MSALLAGVLFISAHPHSFGQTQFRTQHYGVEDGLSQSSVWCTLQDRRGFLWFGTADGLNRYDGYSFRVFRHNPEDSTSLSNNLVWSLCEDTSGAIWVGTAAGIHRYDPRTESFARLADQPRYKGTYLEAPTRTILENHEGLLWFGTINGLAILDPVSGALKQVALSEFQPAAPIPGITVLHEDDSGNVWLGTTEYLFRYERTTGTIRRVPVGEKDQKLFPFRSWKDHGGVYWFATVDKGVWSFNPGTGRWQHYINDPLNPTSLIDNHLRSVCEDNDGMLWFGTIRRGLCYLDQATGRFHSFKPSDEGTKNARYEGVSAILRDRSGLLWVGYDGAGVVKLNPYPNKFNHILLPQSDVNATGDNFFKALMVDHLGDVWLGMYDQGLSVLNRNTGRVKRYRHSSDPRGLCGNTILALLEDKTGSIWIGTTDGLDEFDRGTGNFKHHDISSFTAGDQRGKVVASLCEDSSGTILIGTITRLLKFDRRRGHVEQVLSTIGLTGLALPPAINVISPTSDGALWIGTLGAGMLKVHNNGAVEKQFTHIPGSINSISHNRVKTILIDPDGILWIGTEEGLNRYNPQNDNWRVYRMRDGLPNDFIYGVLMDEKRNLWISTNRGISRMDTRDPDHPMFRNYTPDDGLQSYEFNTNCYFKMNDGHMLFGGVNGFNIFHPDSVRDNSGVPQIALTYRIQEVRPACRSGGRHRHFAGGPAGAWRNRLLA
ncbi:MAG: signal transduction histidine kinase [Bacteroidetes bacterium]|nr:signal transduction histidine kinase [Bacteroidota bacterium]